MYLIVSFSINQGDVHHQPYMQQGIIVPYHPVSTYQLIVSQLPIHEQRLGMKDAVQRNIPFFMVLNSDPLFGGQNQYWPMAEHAWFATSYDNNPAAAMSIATVEAKTCTPPR